MTSHYILCSHCGKTYDSGGNMGELHTTNSGETVHKDQSACIFHLKEQIRYMEQYRLEHDARYCDLEAAVKALTEGRKAAVEESRTLKAIREKVSADQGAM